jgi:antagonist of KipI
MSLRIVKNGLADSIQDAGRFGYQHLGINPGGAMDKIAMKIANALVGNTMDEAVIELAFPPSTFVAEEPLLLALSGADFGATINGRRISPFRPFVVNKGDELRFGKRQGGAYAYLAVKGGWNVPTWLGSKSTNIKCNAGGYHGRTLRKSDVVSTIATLDGRIDSVVFPWTVNTTDFYRTDESIRVLKGAEFSWLTEKDQQLFLQRSYSIVEPSDRMGYRLKGTILKKSKNTELISTAIDGGTIQLLPDGSLIVLLADHQTTGGYPRIGHIISADIPTFVQSRFNKHIRFSLTSLEEAENAQVMHSRLLTKLSYACRFKLREWV